jgi:hypothetical protein
MNSGKPASVQEEEKRLDSITNTIADGFSGGSTLTQEDLTIEKSHDREPEWDEVEQSTETNIGRCNNDQPTSKEEGVQEEDTYDQFIGRTNANSPQKGTPTTVEVDIENDWTDDHKLLLRCYGKEST